MADISSTVQAKRTTRWIRTAGIGAMIGSGAVLAATLIDNLTDITSVPATPEYVATWTMLTVGALLLLLGAIAVYARYDDEFGYVGASGTAIAGLGFLSMIVGGAWSAIYTGPANETLPGGGLVFAGLLVAMLGSLVLAFGLRRAQVATRAAMLLFAAPVVLVLTFIVGEAVTDVVNVDLMWILFLITFSTGWIALGDALRFVPEVTVTEPTTPVA